MRKRWQWRILQGPLGGKNWKSTSYLWGFVCLWGIYSTQVLSIFLNVSSLSDREHKHTEREDAQTATGVLVKPDFSTQLIKPFLSHAFA